MGYSSRSITKLQYAKFLAAVLAYLARYTHRVAISNSRLIAADERGITFRYKDYRVQGPGRYKTMTLAPHEFIRRFLIHVLPKGFHRIRHYGLFANSSRVDAVARARALIGIAAPDSPEPNKPDDKCPCCGGRMVIVEIFQRNSRPHYEASAPLALRIDTS